MKTNRKDIMLLRDLASQYGLEELRDYINRSRLEIDRRRGWPFIAENAQVVE